jgi:hypothetical protein
MKWPHKRAAEAKAEAVQARHEYERVVQNSFRVSDILAALRYHAEENQIVEKIQRVARGTR